MSKITNIRSERIKSKFNIGIIIFGAMLIYIVYLCYSFFSQPHIASYEVQKGNLSKSSRYTGIALREEELVKSDKTGYVNYYVPEGSKARYSQLVYTLDPTGKLKNLISDTLEGDSNLKEEELNEIRDLLIEQNSIYDTSNYEDIYNTKKLLLTKLFFITNNRIIENKALLKSNGIDNKISYGRNAIPGYIVYSYDGYEQKAAEDLRLTDFNKENYVSIALESNVMRTEEEPVYKVITSEFWDVIIPIDETMALKLTDDSIVEVLFTKTQQYSWATATVYSNMDGYFARLRFNNSVITFSKDRFVDIELNTDYVEGLKIPNSAIKEKQFFMIPVDYVMHDPNKDAYSILRRTYEEDGNETYKAFDVSVYNQTEEFYYVSSEVLNYGDVIRKLDSQDAYTISQTGTLIGVYNVNKAYADFKQITILEQNDEYAIIQPNNKYGLTVFDHIVLDADTVNDDTFIYK